MNGVLYHPACVFKGLSVPLFRERSRQLDHLPMRIPGQSSQETRALWTKGPDNCTSLETRRLKHYSVRAGQPRWAGSDVHLVPWGETPYLDGRCRRICRTGTSGKFRRREESLEQAASAKRLALTRFETAPSGTKSHCGGHALSSLPAVDPASTGPICR